MKVTFALDRVDGRVVGGSHIATSLTTWSARAPQLWLFESKLFDESGRRNRSCFAVHAKWPRFNPSFTGR